MAAKEVFTILDFETTGLDHNNEQVVEVAAIRTDLEQELGRLHLLVRLKDGKKLPDFLLDNTDLTDEMLENGVEELQAMIILSAFIGNSTLVAHYAPFDFAFLNNYGIQPVLYLCTRSIERFLNPKESASLAPTAERYGVKLEGAHRAMNDIEATVGVLKAQLAEIKKRGIKRQAIQNLIIDSSERPNRFTPHYARVMKLGKGELQGKRVRVTQEGRNFGKVGTVVDSYNAMNEAQDKICIVDVGTFPHILAHEDHLEVVENA